MDEEDRSWRRTPSRPGSTIPAPGPSAHLRDSGHVRYVGVSDEEALAAFRRTCELEGIVPALEPAHAIAWLLANPAPGVGGPGRSPGRGDRDLAEVLG